MRTPRLHAWKVNSRAIKDRLSPLRDPINTRPIHRITGQNQPKAPDLGLKNPEETLVMKNIETSRIRKGQLRTGACVETVPNVKNAAAGPKANNGWLSTQIQDRQSWGQELWPDCLD